MFDLRPIHQRFCDYSFTFKGNTKTTIQWFRDSLSSFIKVSGATQIKDLNKSSVENWILKGKLERGWCAKTIRERLLALSLFVDWGVTEKYFDHNFIKDIPRPKLPKRIPQHLKKEEAMTLLDWTRNYPYEYAFEKGRAIAIMYTFIFTGIRLQELRNLKMEDIDLLNRSLTVHSGKGEKDRMIPLNHNLIRVYEDYLAHRKRLKRGCPYFFVTLRDDEQMGHQCLKRLVDKLRKKSRIHFYPHLLRHTFATLMLEGGCDLFALSKMMGHSDIKTTTIYLSATTSHLREQIGKHPLEI